MNTPTRHNDAALEDRLRADARARIDVLTDRDARRHGSPEPVAAAPPRRLTHAGWWSLPLAAAAAVALVWTWPAGDPTPPAATPRIELATWTRQAQQRVTEIETAWNDRLARASRTTAAAGEALDAAEPVQLLNEAGDAMAEPYRREWQALRGQVTRAVESVIAPAIRGDRPT